MSKICSKSDIHCPHLLLSKRSFMGVTSILAEVQMCANYVGSQYIDIPLYIVMLSVYNIIHCINHAYSIDLTLLFGDGCNSWLPENESIPYT